MPNRIIKESICESVGLAECSFFANDLYKRLITYADDYGRFNADTQIMLARLYPREMDCVSQEDVALALIELAGVGKVAFYTSNPRKTVYGCLPKWAEHQRVRESKTKCPDPDDTTINDWYLQRFIPIDLRVEIIERDGFKCQICGKFITSDKDARRLVKHANRMYHIDHIVPVVQGGRATLENLRLTCPQCNQKRKRLFTFKEILAFAETRGNSPQTAALIQSNPIRIQSEYREEDVPDTNVGNNPPTKRFKPPTVEQVAEYCKERSNSIDPQRFVDYYTGNGWMVGKTKMRDWKATVRSWERTEFSKKNQSRFDERSYTEEELNARIRDPLAEFMEGMEDGY